MSRRLDKPRASRNLVTIATKRALGLFKVKELKIIHLSLGIRWCRLPFGLW